MEFTRFYTVAEVNQLLPELREQLAQLQAIKAQHQLKREQLQELKLALLNHSGTSPDDGGDPFFTLECEIEFLEIQAKQMLKKFAEQEILIKSIDAGLVDFPAKIDGEIVLLCWLKEESHVKHFHGLNDGFWGRRKLDEEPFH